MVTLQELRENPKLILEQISNDIPGDCLDVSNDVLAYLRESLGEFDLKRQRYSVSTYYSFVPRVV